MPGKKNKGAKFNFNGAEGVSQLISGPLSITLAMKQVLLCIAEGGNDLCICVGTCCFLHCICFSCLHVCVGAIHQLRNPRQKSN